MSVVGFDIGNESSVIAVVRGGGVEVIQNEVSSRETASMVALGAKERFLGEAAKTQHIMNFQNTVTDFKRLIGRKFSEREVQEELPYLCYQVRAGANDSIEIEVQSGDRRVKFDSEMVMAMFMTKLKQIAEKELALKVVDCVISVPGWFTDAQRHAIMGASKIAQLNVLKLMNDTSAAALSYGFYKTDLEEEKPRHLMITDMGESNFGVSVVALYKSKMQVLATSYDRTLGGRTFTRLLMNHFIEEFKVKFKLDVTTNKKALLRLSQAAEKFKKVLSSNAEAHLSIECLMNDKDVKSQMKRGDYEEMCKPLFERALIPIREALEAAKLTPGDISVIEVVGGAMRVPALKEALGNFLGQPLSNTMNNSEAVSRGLALQCAMLSPIIRVRKYDIMDIQPYPMSLVWNEGGETRSSEVFKRNDSIPSTKAVTFYRSKAFEIASVYSSPELLPPGTPVEVGAYTISALPEKDSASKVKVRCTVNESGIFSILSAQTVEEVEVEEKDDGVKDVAKGDEADTPKGGDTAPMETTDGDKKKKIKKVTAPLVVQTVNSAMSEQQVNDALAMEAEMELQDRIIRETAEARNAVETYVYDMRSKIAEGGLLFNYMTSADREKLTKMLAETEDWLYSEGDDTKKAVYVAKLKELHDVGEPAVARLAEEETRPEAIASLQAMIAEFNTMAGVPDERYAHIEQTEKDKVLEKTEEARKWLADEMAKQAALKRTDNPTLLVKDLKKKRADVERFSKPIMSKSKPKPPPPPKEEAKPTEATPEASASPASDAPAPEAAAEGAAHAKEMDLD